MTRIRTKISSHFFQNKRKRNNQQSATISNNQQQSATIRNNQQSKTISKSYRTDALMR
jgi:hypothetical protein